MEPTSRATGDGARKNQNWAPDRENASELDQYTNRRPSGNGAKMDSSETPAQRMGVELHTREPRTKEEQAPKENHIEQKKMDPGRAYPLDPKCAQNKQIGPPVK
jgi:hypothetical protein